jgi:hypothetical protein
MIKTWSSAEADDITCDNCGAEYEVTIRRFPAKDHDSFNCIHCDQLLQKLNDTAVPSFTLKKPGAPEKTLAVKNKT